MTEKYETPDACEATGAEMEVADNDNTNKCSMILSVEELVGVEFLRALFGDSECQGARIPQEGGRQPIAQYGKDPDSLADFINEWNGKENLYYSPTVLKSWLNKKSEKTDIASSMFFWVDVDPGPCPPDSDPETHFAAERERLSKRVLGDMRVPRPTFIVDTGGGFQLLWKLDTPFEIDGKERNYVEFERYNKALAAVLGGDNCHNVDRILRLPGCLNLPNKGKRAKGQVEATAKVIEYDPSRVYSLDQFKQSMTEEDILPKQSVRGCTAVTALDIDLSNIPRLADIDDLDRWSVPDRLKALIVQGDLRDVEGPKEGDDSRSAWLFDVVCNLHRAGVEDDVIYSIITDPDFGISESVLDKGTRVHDYAVKQIESAKKVVVRDDFARDTNNRPYPSQRNIRLALRKLKVSLAYNEFSQRTEIEGLSGFGPHLDDAAVIHLWLQIEVRFKFRPKKEFFFDVLSDAARLNTYHPVRDYLDQLQWDGQERIEKWLFTYMGAEDTAYTRAVGKLLLVGAVRRIREPGCKFDEMVIFESDQGMNKSSALQTLAVRDEWFGDDLPLGAEGRVVVEQTRGKWILEAGELKGMSARRVGELKNFLSSARDRARMSYGRLEADHPRHFVIVGTTNEERYLKDRTGNRRFWPVTVRDINLEALRSDLDQLWAEAALLERQGESIRLDPGLWSEAAAEQGAREEIEPWQDLLAEALDGLEGKIRSADVWKLVGVQPGNQTQNQNNRLGSSMKALGWERKQLKWNGKDASCYVRGSDAVRQRQLIVEGDSGIVRALEPREEETPF